MIVCRAPASARDVVAAVAADVVAVEWVSAHRRRERAADTTLQPAHFAAAAVARIAGGRAGHRSGRPAEEETQTGQGEEAEAPLKRCAISNEGSFGLS
jgi:hypothetical protein